jgi:hypothetical protein
MEKKVAKIDGKEIQYNEFSVNLQFNNSDDYKLVLPLDSKSEKEIVAQLIDTADFQLRVKERQDGVKYFAPYIVVNLGGEILIPVKLRADGLKLVQVSNNFN